MMLSSKELDNQCSVLPVHLNAHEMPEIAQVEGLMWYNPRCCALDLRYLDVGKTTETLGLLYCIAGINPQRSRHDEVTVDIIVLPVSHWDL